MLLVSKRVSILVVAIVLALSLIGSLAMAQEENQGGSGLQLSPTRTDLSGQPGEQKTFSIILKNITQTDVSAEAVLNDFESDNVSGTPRIIVDENARTPYSINGMVKDLTSVDLKAGETKEVKLTVDIPGDVSPGAYFGAIRYAAIPKGQSPSETDRQVALTASVAHLVFIEVAGEINEQIQVEKFQAQNEGKAGSFFIKSPNQAALTVKNLGNGFSRPFGKVTVNGPFGKEAHSYDINNTDPRGIVLPKSSRVFTDELKNIKFPGKYNMTASVAYGNGGEVVTFKSSFIYLPLWSIAVLIALIAVIAFAVYYFYRKRYGKTNSKKRR